MTSDEVLKWIAELFEEPVENIVPARLRDDIPAWDSLGVLNLIAGLDEDFNIQLSDEDILELKSVGDIISLLRKYEKLI